MNTVADLWSFKLKFWTEASSEVKNYFGKVLIVPNVTRHSARLTIPFPRDVNEAIQSICEV